MRTVLVVLMSALPLENATLSAASQCLDNHPAVTVQIRDYAHLKSDHLSKARELVTRMYKRVGVGIEWLGAIPEDVGGKRTALAGGAAHLSIAQLTINIVTPSMARRGGFADDVLGFVAVPPEGGMGRIGYVVYERIRDVAAGGPANTTDILGLIIAHDIGRLILGAGSGTHDGVMNRQWDRHDLERVNPLALEFTPPEIERLRTTLERNSTSSPVGTGGSVRSECLSSRDNVE